MPVLRPRSCGPEDHPMTDPARWPAVVAIALADEDATLADRDEAMHVAQDLADELNEPVTIRDPIDDRLLATITPTVCAETVEDLARYREAMRD